MTVSQQLAQPGRRFCEQQVAKTVNSGFIVRVKVQVANGQKDAAV